MDLDNILIDLGGNTSSGLVRMEGWLMGLGLVGECERTVELLREVGLLLLRKVRWVEMWM